MRPVLSASQMKGAFAIGDEGKKRVMVGLFPTEVRPKLYALVIAQLGEGKY